MFQHYDPPLPEVGEHAHILGSSGLSTQNARDPEALPFLASIVLGLAPSRRECRCSVRRCPGAAGRIAGLVGAFMLFSQKTGLSQTKRATHPRVLLRTNSAVPAIPCTRSAPTVPVERLRVCLANDTSRHAFRKSSDRTRGLQCRHTGLADVKKRFQLSAAYEALAPKMSSNTARRGASMRQTADNYMDNSSATSTDPYAALQSITPRDAGPCARRVISNRVNVPREDQTAPQMPPRRRWIHSTMTTHPASQWKGRNYNDPQLEILNPPLLPKESLVFEGFRVESSGLRVYLKVHGYFWVGLEVP